MIVRFVLCLFTSTVNVVLLVDSSTLMLPLISVNPLKCTSTGIIPTICVVYVLEYPSTVTGIPVNSSVPIVMSTVPSVISTPASSYTLPFITTSLPLTTGSGLTVIVIFDGIATTSICVNTWETSELLRPVLLK